VSEVRPVRLLDEQTANQIAAGEVVERPSSVIKELVDNALDAGARNLVVSLDAGGKLNLRVVDDGHGMTKDDALMAIRRHGTSKITDAEDLDTVESLGFRGEALPSIASVSKFFLRSKRRSTSKGVSLEIVGGEIQSVDDLDCQEGTSVEVENLFFNTPARRKFLKSDRSENSFIKNLLIDYYCAFPEVNFKLVADGKQVLNLHEGSDFISRAQAVLALWKVCQSEETKTLSLDGVPATIGMKTEAVFAPPIAATANSGRLRILVNSRPVRDKVVIKAIRDGFGGFLKPGKYPIGFLSLNLPFEDIDFNVHPQKSEVRFRYSDQVYKHVLQSVRRLLGSEARLSLSSGGSSADRGFGNNRIPESQRSQGESQSSSDWSGSPRRVELASLSSEANSTAGFSRPKPSGAFSSNNNSYSGSIPQTCSLENDSSLVEDLGQVAAEEEPRFFEKFRFLAQTQKCFLLFEYEESLFLLDQHAAHERVVYAKFMRTAKGHLSIERQVLLLPETLQLSAEQAAKYEKIEKNLSLLGFLCELSEGEELQVKEVPSLLAGGGVGEILDELLSNDLLGDTEVVIAERIAERIARQACHNSVRAGRELEPEEAYQLLKSVTETSSGEYCPHGRPVMIEVGRLELERRFGRSK